MKKAAKPSAEFAMHGEDAHWLKKRTKEVLASKIFNPYLVLMKEVHDRCTSPPGTVDLLAKEIYAGKHDLGLPSTFSWMFRRRNSYLNVEKIIFPQMARSFLTKTFSFAVPTQRAIERIAEFSPIIEIGAGSGYWASLLKQKGADIVAYDTHQAHHAFGKWARSYVRTRPGGPEMISQHPDHTLFLCWPPIWEKMDSECLRNYRGEHVIYVGELGDCTGSEKFAEDLPKKFERVEQITLPQWEGIHDQLEIWRRKKKRSRRK